MRDETITLSDTGLRELPAICKMEQGAARHFILPYSLERHQEEFAKPTVVYKSIRRGGYVVGFVILALDPDGQSAEFRRSVVSEPGHGIGTCVVQLVREHCRHKLGRSRIWLDVFESNERARHLYEKSGYARFGASEHGERALLLYERTA